MTVLSLSNLKKTWYYFQKNGVRAAYLAALERLAQRRKAPYIYEPPSESVRQKQRNDPVSDIRFSLVIPAFETKPEYLEALLDSINGQTYRHWEAVLADASRSGSVRTVLEEWTKKHQIALERENSCSWQDCRVRYLRLEKNGGISQNTNVGIDYAEGDYIGLLDHDDLLTPDALYAFASAIEEGKRTGRRPQLLYSDEDKCDDAAASFYEPHFKRDFNLDLLLSNNYICHFLAMENGLMKKLKLRSGFDGAQDYDLVLRAAGLGARFLHVPRVLYHWRCHSDSTAANPKSKAYAYEAGKRAVEDFCRQAGWKVSVAHLKHLGFYRVDYTEDIWKQRPELGVIAGPLPDRRRLRSGIYEKDGGMRYAGLKKGFSGPMHTAALQQDVECADLRSMRVRRELLPLYEEALKRLEAAERKDELIRQESISFCGKVREAGYLILWDPCASVRDCDKTVPFS